MTTGSRRSVSAPGPPRGALRPRFRAAPVDGDPAAAEGIDPAPATGDVEQLEVADRVRQCRVDDEVVADRLEPEHRPEQEQRRPGRPGLRAAGGRVLDRVLRQRPVVAAERLRQPPVEQRGGVEDVRRDAGRLLLVPVAPQPPGDERVVERPDRPEVIADRVVAGLALGQRSHAPARVQPRPHQVADDRLRLRGVDDAAPQEEPVVRRERIDLAAVGVEGDREVPAIGQPEVAVEAPLEVAVPPARAGPRTPGPSRPAGPAVRHAAWRRRRSPGARRSPAGSSGSRPSLYEIEFQESFQDWFSMPVCSLRRLYEM